MVQHCTARTTARGRTLRFVIGIFPELCPGKMDFNYRAFTREPELCPGKMDFNYRAFTREPELCPGKMNFDYRAFTRRGEAREIIFKQRPGPFAEYLVSCWSIPRS